MGRVCYRPSCPVTDPPPKVDETTRLNGCVPLPEWTGMDMITGMDIKFTGMDLYFLSQAT